MTSIIAAFKVGPKLYFIDDAMRIWKLEMVSGMPQIMQIYTLPYGVLEP